jgi:uncharacterized damage-inducible protein DinB
VIPDPFKTYDYLVLVRKKIFDWVRPLSAAQYAQEFPFGPKTIGRTLTHALGSEWYYVMRIEGNPVPPYDEWAIREEDPLPLAAVETAWAEQALRTRKAIGAVKDWNAEFEYQVTNDEGRLLIVTASAADIYTQLLFHEIHHRSHVMSMLRHLGVALEDVDFNALMYKRREASPA